MMASKPTTEKGLSLVIALIVATVALAVGLSLLDVTLRQFILSGIARDSEISFHAAYAGIECARYQDVQNDVYAVPASGNNSGTSVDCMGDNDSSGPAGSGSEQNYEYDWGSANDACTEISVYKYNAAAAALIIPYTVTGGDSSADNRTCDIGSICTVIQSRGYNVACSDRGITQTVEREVVVIY